MIVYRTKQYGLLGDRVLRAGKEYFPTGSRRMDNAIIHAIAAQRGGRRALTNIRTKRTAIRENNLKADRAFERRRNEYEAANENYDNKYKELRERRRNKEMDWDLSKKIDRENYEEKRQAKEQADKKLKEELEKIDKEREWLRKMPTKSKWDLI